MEAAAEYCPSRDGQAHQPIEIETEKNGGDVSGLGTPPLSANAGQERPPLALQSRCLTTAQEVFVTPRTSQR